MTRTPAPAADGTVISSFEGTQWVCDKTSPPRELPSKKFHEVSTTFKLPITASELYFVSRGSSSSGAITVVPLAGEHSAEVVVHVSATYDDASALKDAYVCALERNGGRGIGIYTPHLTWPRLKKHLEWKIAVHVPAGAHVAALSTDLTLFRHELDGAGLTFGRVSLCTSNAEMALQSLVVSDSLRIQTTNARVTCAAAHAASASVVTTNNAIAGDWAVSDMLVLRTTNGPITAQLSLGSLTASRPATAELVTTNGAVESDVSLLGPGPGGAFTLAATTSNAPLRMAVQDVPADSALRVRATTSNARAAVALSRAFVGTFRAATSNARAALDTADGARIAEGVQWNKQNTQVQGRVGREPRGSVELMTTNGPAELSLL